MMSLFIHAVMHVSYYVCHYNIELDDSLYLVLFNVLIKQPKFFSYNELYLYTATGITGIYCLYCRRLLSVVTFNCP